jgi:hypothetical protein
MNQSSDAVVPFILGIAVGLPLGIGLFWWALAKLRGWL